MTRLRSCSPPITWTRPTGSPDRLAIVDHGRVVAEGEPGQLKAELGAPSLDEVYLHYAGRQYSDAQRLTEVFK